MQHAEELNRCLREVDLEGVRRLWKHIAPHLPQPESDDECLVAVHMARVRMKSIHPHLQEYSKRWLKERENRKVVSAVGVIVGTTSPRNKARAEDLRGELGHTVMVAYNDGVDLDVEAPEVKRRMRVVMKRIRGE